MFKKNAMTETFSGISIRMMLNVQFTFLHDIKFSTHLRF